MNELRSSNKMEHNQLLLVEEILSASKRKSERGRRYNKEWVMLCMFFHIRSLSGYAYLRNNNILPLPCTRTIRKYLSIINTSCGFDPKFFEIFKMNLSTKPEMQKPGLLLLDEMSVRESISVNSKTVTYSGLIDFGPKDEDLTSLPKPTSLNDKATHALVFMFQPLAGNYTQPIAVIAQWPVKGVTLAQLIIKATILLEKSGAYVHGFIADGAQTNRKVWNEYGLRGKLNNCQNYVEHFVDPERKFFAFSDTPHLLKNIRNRFYNKKELEVSVT
ncbi:unnamed protein product [Macrosiphum euphorbiae]|uniref:Transposable element P transposase-like RNase H domain-containing protein n=1 Tax=Macrosiphum euphorbiae TaxID=13131 RepID=A0AAV0Y4X8_9HEMI|nr:unnamed protein product [Macrosiphum euphorbiae]